MFGILITEWCPAPVAMVSSASKIVETLSKGPNTTTWIWNLHADAHDFDSHTSDLEEISRKVFSAHFGQLGVIFIWLSGCETNY